MQLMCIHFQVSRIASSRIYLAAHFKISSRLSATVVSFIHSHSHTFQRFAGSATGNPTPQITWKLDGFPLPEVCIFILNVLKFYLLKNGYSLVARIYIHRTKV